MEEGVEDAQGLGGGGRGKGESAGTSEHLLLVLFARARAHREMCDEGSYKTPRPTRVVGLFVIWECGPKSQPLTTPRDSTQMEYGRRGRRRQRRRLHQPREGKGRLE